MSQLFELKLEINPADQKKLVASLGLQHAKDYSDTDYFLKSEDPKLKEKIKELQEGAKHYKLFFDGEVFDIQGEDITAEQAQSLKERGIEAEIHRTKNVYHWPEPDISCAFDHIAELPDRLFFEVYDQDRDIILQSKAKLKELDYDNYIEAGYDDLVSARSLKSYIIDRTNNIVNDCHSFWYLRSEEHKAFKSNGLGGGNLLMAIGLFAALENLANIWRVLTEGKLAAFKDQDGAGINAEISFSKFIPALPINLRLGFTVPQPNELKTLWQQWRNSLMHLTVPRGTSYAYGNYENDVSLNYAEFQEHIGKDNSPVFWKPNTLWVCRIDLLVRDLQKIAEWLAKQVDLASPERVKETLDWHEHDLNSR